MEIIPAIMPQSYTDITDHVVASVDEGVDMVQLDIMDGKFVPPKTWPFSASFTPRSASVSEASKGAALLAHEIKDSTALSASEDWQKMQTGDLGLPLWESLDYEFDLMIADPATTIAEWIALGPKRIILHLESIPDPIALLQSLQDVRTSIEIGLAVNNDTPLEQLYPHLEVIDYVQFMGIARIGYQSQPFDERALDRIVEFKKEFPHIPLQIDGSVNNDTIEMLENLGVDRVVVGSAFFRS
jgi:pentose-5-phosphate-3-epimerase